MKLQFKQQQFQIDAVKAVVDCFDGQPIKTNRFTLERSREIIRQTKMAAQGIQEMDFAIEEAIGYRNSTIQLLEQRVLENIRAVQSRNDLHESAKIERPKGFKDGFNLTVEMETGTGKTYTYIRTMYELQKKYGWSKYIVIVPSVAIREGVYKSFQVTQDHFQEMYGQKIAPFIYNSSRPQDVENFASDSRISVMIINTQAFNKKHTNVMHEASDRFGSRKPIEIIAQTNPIIVIDEPQSVDGDKTLDSMQEFKPLFSLRYSATHKVDYNKVYRLDALDAYNEKLVKKIQVKGISVKGSTGTEGYLYLEDISLSSTKPPFAVMEFETRDGSGVKRITKKLEQGASIYELSGNLPAYKNVTIQHIDGLKNTVEVGGIVMTAGDILNDQNESAYRRIQIRECIKSHLEKESSLFKQGIKVLSLFFIDSVDKYRQYDEAGDQVLGEYGKMFEEEYKQLTAQPDLWSPEYNAYLQRDEASRVHNGYFSIDKKGRSVDSKLGRKEESASNEDAERAYDLIMKDKERLLDLEEPVRFIFSHSALKEGWDNPNVFQICALKNVDSGSETRRRQEVGRGMRLCVNQDGIRQDFQLIGDQVHDINKLTVIASESYEAFAKGLQDEIAKTLKDRPTRADEQFFIDKVVTNARGDQRRFTPSDANDLEFCLISDRLIDSKRKITTEGKERIETGDFTVPEHLVEYKDGIQKLLKTIWTGEEIKPEDERKRVVLTINKNFEKKEFKELWDRINLKSIYEVQFDSAKLIEDSRVKINAQLAIGDQLYELRTGSMKTGGSAEQMKEGELFRVEESQAQFIKANVTTDAVYDLVGEIESRTHLTRRTIVDILKAIHEEKFLLVRKNPEAFIAKVSELINEVKASLIFNKIVYHKTEERHEASTVFTNDKTALRESEQLHKHIYDYLTTDSTIEANFAQELEAQNEVIVYAKLPKSFFVPTPVANYSPDWAIVIDKDTERHVYFVAETKGSDSDQDLREIERLKIHCAERHFQAIGEKKVIFKKVATYASLREHLASA